MSELRPCWCPNSRLFLRTIKETGRHARYKPAEYVVECDNCGLHTYPHVSPQDAENAWNSHSREDALQARIDELEINLDVKCKDFQALWDTATEVKSTLTAQVKELKDNFGWVMIDAASLLEQEDLNQLNILLTKVQDAKAALASTGGKV